jgi:F-type H+-transporting ATPase subunit gamma
MANIRDIKTRIHSVRNTRQITNAMKMVAAAKLRKAQERIFRARPYADNLNTMIRTLQYKNKKSIHPLFEENPQDKKKALISVTSDRGLCGSFKTNILRKAETYLKKESFSSVICLGKKGYSYFKRHQFPILNSYLNLFNEMNFAISIDVASEIINLFINEKYDKIEVIYNEFKSAIQQDVVIKQLLPIVPLEKGKAAPLDYIYEPNEVTIMEELGKKYIDVEIWRIMLESSAAEQGARMTAMDSATDNASDLIEQLTLYYNRARQAAITKEIIEISSGAEALK